MTPRPLRHSHSGYSLIEIMLVVCVLGILGSMAAFQIPNLRSNLQGDGAMRVVMGELNVARELAITQRRKIRVDFVGTNRLQMTRIEVDNVKTTLLRDIYFESGVQYSLVSGVGADTPDGFGNGEATDFGNATTIMFNTEGSLVDQKNIPLNGTVFLAIPGNALSFRAVTVQGATGRVRGYRWTGAQWRRV
jgi:prepilin-type N-terminal cleavage/methylation domain-containing protein